MWSCPAPISKGHDVLIDALAQLTDLPWRAEIIGKPHELETAQALASQITESGLTSRVALTGELRDRVQRGDVLRPAHCIMRRGGGDRHRR